MARPLGEIDGVSLADWQAKPNAHSGHFLVVGDMPATELG